MLDYPIAFGAIGLAGLARKLPSKYGFVVGIVLVGVVRFVCHTISGVVFFASYADGTGLSPLVYSLSYNSFVFVDLAIDLVVIAIPAVRRALESHASPRPPRMPRSDKWAFKGTHRLARALVFCVRTIYSVYSGFAAGRPVISSRAFTYFSAGLPNTA